MKKVGTFIMPFESEFFSQGQRVYIVFPAGETMMMCHGRYKNSGEYVKSWVQWESQSSPAIEVIEVEDAFYAQIRMFH